VVQRRHLLREEGGLARGRDHHRRHEGDPLGDRRRRGERHQFLVGVEDAPADRAQDGEAAVLGSGGPVDERASPHALQRVR